jgi:hypothetical protein
MGKAGLACRSWGGLVSTRGAKTGTPLGFLIYLAPTLLTVICVVHAVKTGRIFPWIYVIVFLPMAGPLAYLAVEVVPDMLRSRGAATVKSQVRSLADPHRSLRDAERAAEMVGSVDSKRTLAEEYLARGRYDEAIALYRSLLVGQFRDDPVLLLGLARAQFASGDGVGAQASLDALQAADPNFQSAEAHLLYARALELQGKDQEALEEYRKLTRYYSGEEARCRYAMLLQKTGAVEDARAIFQQILKFLDGAPRHYRQAQKQWSDIARAALK